MAVAAGERETILWSLLFVSGVFFGVQHTRLVVRKKAMAIAAKVFIFFWNVCLMELLYWCVLDGTRLKGKSYL